ncbi:MAG: crossover junction endodeoxyribonuclease RuvC [Bacteroidales bacterium]|nr:crossover junction endodeoxyribonuclease RuvC [Bacteroidales bacterium]
MRILGIDPGTNLLGWAVLDTTDKKAQVVVMGVLDLAKLADHYAKLKYIYERITSIVNEYKPDELSIEAPFFGKNVQSMLKLGRAQGVCIAIAAANGMPVTEYAPMRIKQAITGQGAASKEQVANILQRMLHFTEMPGHLDATDALAAAYCHFLQTISPLGAPKSGTIGGPAKSWKEFALRNPSRIKK